MGDMAQLDSAWPALPLKDWRDTYLPLQLWTQVVGKIRMTLSPPLNHWWHTTLYVTARGLSTSPIPFGAGAFEIQFDLLDHQLQIQVSDGRRRALPLAAEPVAVFYTKLMDALHGFGIACEIRTKPQEMAVTLPFEADFEHGSYDREFAGRFFRVLLSSHNAMQ